MRCRSLPPRHASVFSSLPLGIALVIASAVQLAGLGTVSAHPLARPLAVVPAASAAHTTTSTLLSSVPSHAPRGASAIGRPAAMGGAAITAGAAVTHTVGWDRYSLTIDGQRVYIRSGDFHYWRLPSPDLWRDILEKMKATGYNTVQIYFDWAFHSPKQGVYDFTGVRDVERLLQMTEQVGLYVIARPGPYINAETDSGGFPGWIETQAGQARTSAADYTAAYMEWLSQIDPILARHQITRIDPATGLAGSVIIYQVENEYSVGKLDPTYMQDIENKAHADGINVPTDHNDFSPSEGVWGTGPGAVDLYAFDSYPLLFDCSHPQNWMGSVLYEEPEAFEAGSRKANPLDPIFIAEYQAGSFDPWGGPGYAACRQLTDTSFLKVYYKSALAQGVTLLNSYMGYGGTSWGWLPFPGVYTSYDYGVAIDEARQLNVKSDEIKRLNYLLQSVAPLRHTDPLPMAAGSNPQVDYRERVDTQSGTQFYFLRQTPIDSQSDMSTTIVVTGTLGVPVTVPQQPGTAIRLQGRDSKIIIAGYDMDAQRLVYSTSELMTHETVAGRDVALFYGRPGEAGETVLNYAPAPAAAPTVTVLAGTVTSTFNSLTGDLRLNYTHDGLARVLIHQGARTLLLLLGTDDEAARFWRQDTAAGPILERGPYLVRSAEVDGNALALRGDTKAASDLEVFAPAGVTSVTWNDVPVGMTPTASGSLLGSVGGPPAVTLPALSGWRFHAESPEAQPGFDDSGWTTADHTTTNNPNAPTTLPVLYIDDYKYHYGDVWFRGHFTATGGETGIALDGEGGANSVYAVWLNGTFIESITGTATIPFPANTLRTGADNVVSVLLENMGHEEDGTVNDGHKAVRGLRQAQLQGSSAALTWRIQGALGGEDLQDPVRGPFNNGGLYGERNGWHLPGYPDADWTRVTLPDHWAADGVPPGVGWYRTGFDLNLPPGTDVPIGLRIADDKARHYRALIYLNGWLLGRYINDLGPQTLFSLPAGILNPNGHNQLAIASWGLDRTTGGLGQISLEAYGVYASPLTVGLVNSPGYVAAPTPSPTATASPTGTPSSQATPTGAMTPSSTPSTPVMPTTAPTNTPTTALVSTPTSVPATTPTTASGAATAGTTAIATATPAGTAVPAAGVTTAATGTGVRTTTASATATPALARATAPARLPSPSPSAQAALPLPPIRTVLSGGRTTPRIMVSPATARSGATVRVTGAGFGARETVTLALNGAALPTMPSIVTTDGDGAFSASIVAPDGLLNGANMLTAIGTASRRMAQSLLSGLRDVATRYYFAGGVSLPGEQSALVVLNPGRRAAHVRLTAYFTDGTTLTRAVTAPAMAGQTVPIKRLFGRAGRFGLALTADQPLGAQLRLARPGRAGDAIAGTSGLDTRWYLAEGYTGLTFHEDVAILNPDPRRAAHVTLRLLAGSGRGGRTVAVTVPAHSERVVDANALAPGRALSVVATSDRGVVVERSLTFSRDRAGRGYGLTARAGINTAATGWLFAEGTTADGFETFLTILNPNGRAARVTVRLYGSAGRTLATRRLVVAAGSRGTVRLNDVVHDNGIASIVTSDAPVVVERPEYVGSPNGRRVAGSDVFGRNGTASRWSFPGGLGSSSGADGAGGAQRSLFLLLFNPSSSAVPVEVTGYEATGRVVTARVVVAAGARATLDLRRIFRGATGLDGVVARSVDGHGFVAEQTVFAADHSSLESTQGLVIGSR